MTDVFMSYAREDSDFVRRIYNDLLKHDRDAWVDWEDIPLTADWLAEAYAGIEGANALVFIISPASVRSGPCRLELEHALANNKRLIPILRQEVTDPEDLKQMHPSLSAHNWVKSREEDDYEKAFAAILNAIDTDLDYVRAHTRYTVRAAEWDNKNHDDSLLLRGSDLREAEAWLHQSEIKQPSATPLQREYILSSRRESARRRRISLIITGVTILIIGLAIIAFIQSIVANRNAEEARAAKEEALLNEERARSLALAANAQRLLYLDNNTDLALALALESNRLQQAPPLAGSILAQAAYTPGTRRQWSDFSEQRIAQLAVSPDGAQAIAVNVDDDLVLINLEDGSEAGRWAMPDVTRSIAFNPTNPKQIAIVLDDDTLALMDLESGEQTPLPGEDKPLALTFSRSGNRLLVGYEGGATRIWELSDSSSRDLATASEEDALSVALSPDGVLALAGFDDGSIALWNVRSGEVLRTFTGHSGRVRGLAFRPNGQEFISASEDYTLILWSVRSTASTRTFVGHTNGVLSVTISPDGNTAYSGSLDGNIYQWTIDTGERDRAFAGHTNTVYTVALLPSGAQLLSGSTDGTLRLWDLENGAQIERFNDYTGAVYSAAFSPDGTRILTASADHQILLWDAQTGSELARYTSYISKALAVAFSPDGTRALAGYEDGTLILLNLESRPMIREIRRLIGHSEEVNGITFSPDGRSALSASYDETVIVWDIESGRALRRMPVHASDVYNVAISPDGLTAISVSSRNDRVIVWNILTGEVIRTLEGHTGTVYDVAFSPDGTTALTGSQDKTLILWDVATGEILRQFSGHTDDVYSVAFSPDGQSALSSSLDSTIRLWDIASGEEVLRYNGHTNAVWDANFSRDGRQIVSASADQTARVWQVTTRNELIQWSYGSRYILPLSCQEREVYRVSLLCAPDGSAPPLLPYQRADETHTASATAPSSTAQSAGSAATATPTVMPIRSAQIGANGGTLAGNQIDFWRYSGKEGEQITILLEAAQPANDAGNWRVQLEQGLMDTLLRVYQPDGTLLDENDDLEDGLTNSILSDIVLERYGEYLIQVSSIRGTAGDYTLTITSVPAVEATPEATTAP